MDRRYRAWLWVVRTALLGTAVALANLTLDYTPLFLVFYGVAVPLPCYLALGLLASKREDRAQAGLKLTQGIGLVHVALAVYFLLGQAFRMLVDVGNMQVLKILSNAAAVIAEGLRSDAGSKDDCRRHARYRRHLLVNGSLAAIHVKVNHCHGKNRNGNTK